MKTDTVDKVIKNDKSKISNLNSERKEGTLAKAIETQTLRLPSDLFLWGTGGA